MRVQPSDIEIVAKLSTCLGMRINGSEEAHLISIGSGALPSGVSREDNNCLLLVLLSLFSLMMSLQIGVVVWVVVWDVNVAFS
jgi:hypothetical protein